MREPDSAHVPCHIMRNRMKCCHQDECAYVKHPVRIYLESHDQSNHSNSALKQVSQRDAEGEKNSLPESLQAQVLYLFQKIIIIYLFSLYKLDNTLETFPALFCFKVAEG